MIMLKRIFCCVALLFVSLFLGIGYAQLSKEFEVKGLLSAEMPKSVFIVGTEIVSQTDTVVNNSIASSTVFNSSTTYIPRNGNASIAFKITFYNGSDLIYQYAETEVNTHSNSNVSYQVSDIIVNQTINPREYTTALVSFNTTVNSTLSSIINFRFVVANTKDNVGIANHESLVSAMLDDPTNGLNNPDSYLNKQITSRHEGSWIIPSRDTLGSMAITQGNTLESMFGDSYATNEKLAFLLQFFDTNNDDVIDYYYLFTTSVVLGPNGSPSIAIGENIYQVYRTKIVYSTEDAKWVSEEILEGYATSAYYEESQLNISINRTKIPSFNPDTWTKGKLGNSFSNAVWTTVNQTSSICAEAESIITKRYYKVTIPSNSNYTFTIETDNETNADDVLLEIYNSNQTLVKSGYGSITFPTNRSNTTYYIVLSGSTTMDFKFIKN